MERILNVAVATDTILYSPFYTAWFGGDFENTPFGSVTVNVIARENDPFFRNDIIENLKAVDGFVTLCLVFGYADVGICDPAFVIQACKTNNNPLLETSFNEFFSALSDLEQKSFKQSHPKLFHDDKIVVAELKSEISSKAVKIVGGLISRIAFCLIGNEKIKSVAEREEKPYVGQVHFGDVLRPFAKSKLKNLICLPEPSTGHCVGATLRNAFDNGASMPISHRTEFGREIDKTIRLEGDDATSTLAFTCDFVSLDYIMANGIDVYEKDEYGNTVMYEKKDETGAVLKDQVTGNSILEPKVIKSKQTIYEAEDWTISENNTAMFTGVLAVNLTGEKQELIQAFLYGIDKNLYQIDKTIEKGKISLSNFFKSKLLTKHPKSDKDNLIRLLIAYPEIEKNCNIDDLIYYYVNRLTKWKNERSSLYYNTVTPNISDLKEMYRIRLSSYSHTPNLTDEEINSFVDATLLAKWSQEESEIKKHQSKWYWKPLTDESKLLGFAATFIALEILSIVIKLTNYHIVDLKLDGIWNLIAVGVLILFIIGVRKIIYRGKRIHYLKERKDYVFRE